MIKNHVGQISASCNKFTSVDNVPTDAGVVMVIDDSPEIRNETQTALFEQTNQHLINYINRKLDSQKIDPDDQIIKKIVSLSLFMVEASSGRDAVPKFRQLLEQKCRVYLILVNANMGESGCGIEAAQTIREIETSEEFKHQNQ